MNNAICLLGIVPLRRDSDDRSELISQIHFGEIVEIQQIKEKWVLGNVQTDDYSGWIDKKQLTFLGNKEYHLQPANNLYCIAPYSEIQLDNNNLPLPYGSIINPPFLEEIKVSVQYDANHFSPVNASIIEEAIRWLNVPYLWGGKTFFGVDCSGFTQIIYRVCGISLPRDSSEQAKKGEAIELAEAQSGDLAFFENDHKRITHVGIVIKENNDITIIHASGKVRIDKLDQQGIWNTSDQTYSHQLAIIKRY